MCLPTTQQYLLVTCNYVARSLGVAKMSPVKEAVRICPQLRLMCGSDLTHYRAYSRRVRAPFVCCLAVCCMCVFVCVCECVCV